MVYLVIIYVGKIESSWAGFICKFIWNLIFVILWKREGLFFIRSFNLLKSTGYVMYQQFNIQ